jgi:hypothetical protein
VEVSIVQSFCFDATGLILVARRPESMMMDISKALTLEGSGIRMIRILLHHKPQNASMCQTQICVEIGKLCKNFSIDICGL